MLAGAIGEYIAMARRRGQDWYIGAMSNEQARTLAVPLSFLGKGGWTATTWSDGEATTDVRKRAERVDAADTLQLDLSGGGGAAVKLSRAGH